MKLRAPRCSDCMLLMSVPARIRSTPPSYANTGPQGKSNAAIKVRRLNMSGDPLWHGLHGIPPRIPGHQQEKSKIHARTDPGEQWINARRRLQSAQAEDDERDHEQR